MKHRSLVDYLEIYSCDKQGYNLGLDASIFIRRQPSRTAFERPRVGTQGKSVGAITASTNIAAGPDNALRISVNGGAVIDVTLTLTGLTTGAAIAAELETAINTALAAASQDNRVWVLFDGGDVHYEVYSQSTGTASAVVITNAVALNVADQLKLGIPNAGTQTVGTNDQDSLLYTAGGPKFSQPVESNPHRSGRFHAGIIRKKTMVDFDMDLLINMSGLAGNSIDQAYRVMMENIFGSETVIASTAIIYKQSVPCFYFSMVKVSTIFGEYFTGGYCKDWTLSIAGDAPGTQKFTGRAGGMVEAGLAQINGAVSASADVILDAGLTDRYDVLAPVMIVAADGRTVVAGIDGSLVITSIDKLTNKLVLSATVSVDNNGFVAPWHPGAVQQSNIDNVYTDLIGSFKFDPSGIDIDTTSIELTVANNHIDLDNRFGKKDNAGFVAGNRVDMSLSVGFDLSNETYAQIVQAKKFGGFAPVITIGDVAGRHLKIAVKNWIPSVPAKELPENGTTPITMEGSLYQSTPGARDPISVEYR